MYNRKPFPDAVHTHTHLIYIAFFRKVGTSRYEILQGHFGCIVCLQLYRIFLHLISEYEINSDGTVVVKIITQN